MVAAEKNDRELHAARNGEADRVKVEKRRLSRKKLWRRRAALKLTSRR